MKMPTFKLPNAKGGKVTLPAPGAKATILLYMRADQERSKKAAHDIATILGKYKAKGLRAIAVATARHSGLAHAKKLAKSLSFPIAVDAKESFRGKCGLYVYPTTGIVGRDRVLKKEIPGRRSDYLTELEDKVRAVLGLPPIKRLVLPVLSPAQKRKLRMKRMMQMMEARRAKRRFFASASLLDSSLPRVLQLYRKWADVAPPPLAGALGALAHAVADGKADKKVIAGLRALAKSGPAKGRGAAQLWLGRALLKAKKKDKAGAAKAFEACVKDKAVALHCCFELATLDAKHARELCKKGFKAGKVD